MSSPVTRVCHSVSTAIQQRLTGGSFDGSLPDRTQVTFANALYKFAPSVAGGLFFWDCNEPIVCGQFHISMGGSGNVSLYLVNLDPASDPNAPTSIAAEDILIEQQVGATFVALDEARFKCIILPGQALKLVTTYAGAQIAQAVASLERTYIR